MYHAVKKLKLGLDFHGVIDTFPEMIAEMSRMFVAAGHEVHVITGLKRDAIVQKGLDDFGIHYTHYFSIVEQLEQDGVTIVWRDGLQSCVQRYLQRYQHCVHAPDQQRSQTLYSEVIY
jgi:hypothetical protein